MTAWIAGRSVEVVRWLRWALWMVLAGCNEPPRPVVGAFDDASVDVNVLSDPFNCGEAGVVCGTTSGNFYLICVNGHCTAPCLLHGRATCDPAFPCATDLSSDIHNCGGCGIDCGMDRCINGTCYPCPVGWANCSSNAPVNCGTSLWSDENCGTCGHVCPTNQRCSNRGDCVDCPEGHSACRDRRCVDLRADRQNCGLCGRVCGPEEVCIAGRCGPCPAGESVCGAACYDLQTDSATCGSCGHECRWFESCVAGACVEDPCPEGTGRCDATKACVSVLADPNNCGGCARACSHAEFCHEGACLACPAGTARCGEGTTCTPILDNPDNCGACGLRCRDDNRTSRTCRGPVCVGTCLPGFVTCPSGSPCGTELAFDDANCGACGHACDGATRCIGGACVSLDARPIAPLSTSILGGRRPHLRWQRAAGIDGVRLQLCADRACSRVESTQDLSVDEFRPTVALSPGVHFWRLFARRGTVVASNASPVWEFVLPEVDGSRGVVDYVRDVDGDGVADAITTAYESDQWVLTVVPSSSPSTPQVRRGISSEMRSIGGMDYRDTYRVDFGCAGDLDGDGFGDLAGTMSHSTVVGSSRPAESASFMFLRGGAPRIAGDPISEPAPDASSVRWSTPGDFDGDGYGDVVVWYSYPGRRTGQILWTRFGGRMPARVPLDYPFVNERNPPVGNAPIGGFAGDFDGNGVTDLVVSPAYGYLFYTWIYRYVGADRDHPWVMALPTCTNHDGYVLAWGSISIADANADGYDDIFGDVGGVDSLGWYVGHLTFLGNAGGLSRGCDLPRSP